ncbi:hypothetical protein [Streptomyces chartreusis]|uniref:hypothetical protein n=1 Tax=Streptomyces chartreusis TaxID=1969 RepID=UPI002E17B86A
MSILPRHTPAVHLTALTEELTAAGITLGPVKPGTRVTRIVDHGGIRWTVTFLGARYGWALRGPGIEHGVGMDVAEIAEHIATAALDEDEPGIPAPATWRGVPVPEQYATRWDSPEAVAWREGAGAAMAHAALAKVAGERAVHVRIGEHRTAYHPDATCPALNGKTKTYRGQEQMTEDEARERGLTACELCTRR